MKLDDQKQIMFDSERKNNVNLQNLEDLKKTLKLNEDKVQTLTSKVKTCEESKKEF